MIKKSKIKSVETLTHEEATRKNIPTAEHQSIMHDADKSPIQVAYQRRNRDLDPQRRKFSPPTSLEPMIPIKH